LLSRTSSHALQRKRHCGLQPSVSISNPFKVGRRAPESFRLPNLRAKEKQFRPPSCCIIRAITGMPVEISSSHADAAAPRQRRYFLCVALWVAALANALVPTVLFSATSFFGQTDPRYRALIAAVVLVEYAIAFLLLLLHANVGFACGYALATAAVVTPGSGVLAFLVVDGAGWHWNALYGEILVLGGLAFAVLSNAVFLVASIRYARAMHPRLHLGGFVLGIGACLALFFLYTRILP
jgi:hypothetical protein